MYENTRGERVKSTVSVVNEKRKKRNLIDLLRASTHIQHELQPISTRQIHDKTALERNKRTLTRQAQTLRSQVPTALLNPRGLSPAAPFTNAYSAKHCRCGVPLRMAVAPVHEAENEV